MKTLLLFSGLFFSALLFAQSDFQKGYLINNQGEKMEGYLKSSNYRTFSDASFSDFEFKKELDQPIQKIEKFNVTEFGTAGEVKYQKMKAMIDDVDFFKEHSNEKNFLVREETVFLKVLVEGKATLYSYDGGKGIKYLWKIADSGEVAKQFLYKQYFKANVNLTENNAFREQLFNHVKCPNQTYKDFLNVKYEKDALISLFTNYNKCSNSPSIVYKEEDGGKFSLKVSLIAGYNFAKFQTTNSNPARTSENFTMPSFGAEVEVFTPSEKISFFFSTEYKKAQAESSYTLQLSEFNPNFTTNTYRLDTGILDFVLGARYYLNFNKLGSVFVGGGLGINAPMATNINDYQTNNFSDLSTIEQAQTLKSNPFVRMQLGYIFNKHYGFDLHFDTTKNLVGNAPAELKLNEMGINLKYTF